MSPYVFGETLKMDLRIRNVTADLRPWDPVSEGYESAPSIRGARRCAPLPAAAARHRNCAAPTHPSRP